MRVILFLIGLMFSVVGDSYAALDLSLVTIDTSQYFVLLTTIIGAIAGIWVAKKLIKMGNRS